MPTKLSPHFTLEEFTISQTAARQGLNNIPSEDIVKVLTNTANQMEAVRKLLGVPIHINSGYRSPEVNKAVGGAKNSQHMTGEAVDFIAPGFGSVATIIERIKSSGLVFDQLIDEYGSWVHISFSDKPRKQVLVVR